MDTGIYRDMPPNISERIYRYHVAKLSIRTNAASRYCISSFATDPLARLDWPASEPATMLVELPTVV